MKPEAGQWWVDNDSEPGDVASDVAVRVAGSLSDGRLCVETDRGVVVAWEFLNPEVWHHEPRCTGWDWVMPEPQPAEDPDEWVIQDKVPPRAHVDVVFWSHWKQGEEVVAQGTWEHPQVHGFTDCFGHQLSVRCRRRDLPKAEQKKTTDDFGMYLESIIAKDPQLKAEVDAAEAELAAIDARLNEPQPQKTRIRLWISGDDGRVYAAYDPCEPDDCDDEEIHHDSEGFYVEGGQS